MKRVLAFLLTALALTACSKAPPSDKAMAERFFAHRAAFEALRTDLCKLKYDQTIAPDWAQPQMRLADEKRYRAQMAALGARSVKYIRGCQLFIEMWASTPGRDTAFKKFRYGPPLYRVIEIKRPVDPDDPPEKDLNTFLDTRVSIASYQKNLEGDWWIEVDHWE